MKTEEIVQAMKSIPAAGEETHPNREGAPAFFRSLKEQTVNVLTCGTGGDTFYATGNVLIAEAYGVLVQMRDENPEFLARALVYARQKGLMKLMPVFGLAVLSAGRSKECKTAFLRVFKEVVLIPDDLRAFVELCLSGSIPGRGGLGGVTRDAVREWMQNLSEYHALKYGSSASKGVTLRDILRLTHPKASTPELNERFGWLVKGKEALAAQQ